MIPGHGPKTSCKIAVVSERPHKEELLHNLPLVGSHGKLLNELFSKAGLRRSLYETYVSGFGYKVTLNSPDIYVTMVAPEAAPVENDFEKSYYLHPVKKGVPTPLLLSYYDALRNDLAGCSANVIIAAGEHALRALCNKRGISNWRGSILDSTLLPGRKVIPIIHPEKILREWYYRSLTIHDLKRVAAQSSFPEIRRPVRDYVLRPSRQDLKFFYETKYSQAEKLSIDIETKGDNISCIGFACSRSHAIVIPFISENGHYWTSKEDEAFAWEIVARLCSSPAKKILQNAQFDTSYLMAHGCRVNNIWWDTMLAQSILYPELEKSLAMLTSIYTEEPYYKAEGRAALKAKSDKAWAPGQNDEKLWLYNARDCAITFEVSEEQEIEFLEMGKERRINL